MNNQFSQKVSEIIIYSKEEANRLRNGYIGPEHLLLGLIRDGMKFREGPKVKNAGNSLAAASRPAARAKTSPEDKTEELQKRAQQGDKSAARDLLATLLSANKRRR